jgi:hypothetical protein
MIEKSIVNIVSSFAYFLRGKAKLGRRWGESVKRMGILSEQRGFCVFGFCSLLGFLSDDFTCVFVIF